MSLTLRKMIAVLSLSWLSMAGHTATLSTNEQQKLDSIIAQLNQLPKIDNKYSQQTMGSSSEERRKVAVAADNAGIKETVINQLLREITLNNKGQYEVFKHNQQSTSDSTISIGSINDSSSATGVSQGQGFNTSLNNQTTGSTGGGGCQKTLTATCS